jgi:proline iminopeptidase
LYDDDIAQVIRFEQRGCGRSGRAASYTVETCLADLEAVRQHYGTDRWIVAGHSWGADLALIYALRHPEHVHDLICIAGGRVHNDREWHQVYQRKRDQGLELPLTWDYPVNLDVNEQVGRSWKLDVQRPTLLKELAGLNRSALLLYGADDIRPSWPIEQVTQLLPNARLELIAGANHYIWLTHAEIMRAHLREFMSQLGR